MRQPRVLPPTSFKKWIYVKLFRKGRDRIGNSVDSQGLPRRGEEFQLA
jgi:hypothetical protein